MLCIRSTGYFKPNSSEQNTSGAKSPLPLAAQFMNVKTRTLHVAARALRIVPTRTLTAHGDAGLLTKFKDKFIEAEMAFDFQPPSSGPSQFAVVRVNTFPAAVIALPKSSAGTIHGIERHQRL